MSVWNLIRGRFVLLSSQDGAKWAAGSFVLIAALLAIFAVNAFFVSPASDENEFLARFRGGTLLIGGGGEMPAIVNQRFWELAGGRTGRLIIIPAYEASREDMEHLKDDWRGWQFSTMHVLQASSREIAEELCFSEPIRRATAVWFSGGDQSRLANL